MGLELGRISGPLLAENLRRNEDLAFRDTALDDPVLYLKVTGTAELPVEIEVGPSPTGVSLTSNSVTLSKAFYSQELVNSLVGQTAVIDRYPNPPLVYTVVSIVTEPLSPTEWRMTVDTTFNPAGQVKPISFYPNAGVIQLVTNDIWDTTGNSIGEKWVAWYKTNLPGNFTTLVQPGWIINVAGTIYVVDYIIEDPVNTNMWRIYVTTSLVGGVGIPIFSTPTYTGTPRFIGVNTDAPNNPLTVLGKTLTTNLVVDTHAETPNFYISTNRIQNLVSAIFLQPDQTTDPQIHAPRVGVLNLRISDLLIENITNNSDITLEANTGQVVFNTSEVYVDGALHATGDITFDGDVTFGTDDTDNVTFSADVASSIIPDDNITWDLGSNSKRWATAYITNSYVDNITIAGLNVATLEANGTTQVDGNAFLGSDSSDVITFTSTIDSSLIPTNGTYTLGNNTTPKIWKTVFLTGLVVDGKIDIRSNTVTTLTTDEALELIANGTGKIYVQYTDVGITLDLNVDGYSTLDNVGITGLLNLPGDYTWTQTGDSDRTGNTNITGTLTLNSPNVTQFQDISVTNNIITTTVTDNDLRLVPDGTGKVHVVTTNVQITNDLDVGLYGYFGSLTVGTGITVPEFTVGDIHISNNDITTISADRDLELSANGTGKVYAPTNDVGITNDLTVTGDTTVNGNTTVNGVEIGVAGTPKTLTQTGNIIQTGSIDVTGNFQSDNIDVLTPSYVILPEITLQGSAITVTSLNSDLNFTANGTGGVVFDRQIKITNNVIQNIFDINDVSLSFNNLYLTEDGQLLLTEDGDNYLLDIDNLRDLSLIFEPRGTGNAIIDSTKAIAIAYGNNVDRDLYAIGEIRQNSTTKLYEGWTPNGLVSFNNIYDSDRNTYITPELTPGANDNTIRFGVAGTVKGSIDSTKLFNNTFQIDNVRISSNSISNSNNALDLSIVTTGTGTVSTNDILFKDNTITNTLNSALIFETLGSGYVKFGGTGAVVIPYGDDSQRRVTPDLGETRYSTEQQYIEIFDGAAWIPASGASSAATQDEIQAETNLWALILG
jgi:hypothetical protein